MEDFHKKQLSILEATLDSDNWMIFNISYRHYCIIDYFFLNKDEIEIYNYSSGEEENDVTTSGLLTNS